MKRRAYVLAVPGSAPKVPACTAAFLISLFAFAAFLGPLSVRLHAESANSIFKHGEAAEAHEDYDTALDFYQKALNKSPNDLTYKTALYRVRVTASAVHMTKGRQLLSSGDEQGALVEYLHAAEIDPGNEAAQQAIAEVRKRQGQQAPHGEVAEPESTREQQELDSIGSPVLLKPLSNDPLTLHYSEDAKVVYQAIGKAAGINVLFDRCSIPCAS
jgi:general secretion pathway protein D